MTNLDPQAKVYELAENTRDFSHERFRLEVMDHTVRSVQKLLQKDMMDSL